MKDTLLFIGFILVVLILLGLFFAHVILVVDCWNEPIAEAPARCLLLQNN